MEKKEKGTRWYNRDNPPEEEEEEEYKEKKEKKTVVKERGSNGPNRFDHETPISFSALPFALLCRDRSMDKT